MKTGKFKLNVAYQFTASLLGKQAQRLNNEEFRN